MRISKGRKSEGGGRDERQRSRERAREARLRREELERRAAELAAAAATTGAEAPEGSSKADDDTPKPKAREGEGLKAAKSKAGKTGGSKGEAVKDPKGEGGSAKAKRDRGDKEKSRGAKSKTDSRPGEARKPIGARAGAAGRRVAKVGRETGRRLALPRLAAATRRPLGWVLRALSLIAFAFFWLLARIDRVARVVAKAVSGPTSAAIRWLGRTLTPPRVAMAVAVLAGAAVLASQLIDYRAVAIGEAAYADVASIAQAPLTGHETPWTAHGPLVGLLAIIATVGAVLTLRGAGRRATFAALGASALALLVILAVDLPRSGDLGAAADEYAGTGSVLLKGFYIELVAVLLIGFSAALPGLWRLPLPRTRPIPLGGRRDPESRQASLHGEKRRTA